MRCFTTKTSKCSSRVKGDKTIEREKFLAEHDKGMVEQRPRLCDASKKSTGLDNLRSFAVVLVTQVKERQTPRSISSKTHSPLRARGRGWWRNRR